MSIIIKFCCSLDESLIIHPLNEYTRGNSLQRSEDNSSADGNSLYGIPAGSVSPKPHEATIRVNAHVHSTEQPTIRTFQTLEASKLLKDQGFAGYITNELLQDEGLIKMAKDDANFIKTMEATKFSNYLSKSNCIESETKTVKSGKDLDFMKSMESSKFSMLNKNGCVETDKGDYGQSNTIVKSTSSDTPLSTGTPVSSSELAAALLCASSTSLSNQGFRNRHRRVGVIEETDLSTPYNHYRSVLSFYIFTYLLYFYN